MNRKVLITGGARGIGAATAALFESKGWTVIAPTRHELDLSSQDSINNWIAGNSLSVDTLINNAGENPIGELSALQMADWERCMMVNLTAPMILSRRAAEFMRQRHWGRIVNVGSIFSFLSRKGRGPYTAAKAGLLGITRTMAIEWGGDNVLVNMVAPGYIETDLTKANNTGEQLSILAEQLPLRRLGKPEEIARAIWFLGSEENTFMTGQSLCADGGFSVQ